MDTDAHRGQDVGCRRGTVITWTQRGRLLTFAECNRPLRKRAMAVAPPGPAGRTFVR